MSDQSIDAAVFAALKSTTGAEFALELVNTFLEETPGMLADLRNARVASDAERFRRAAHSLKSNANTFGAMKLASAARALELNGIDADAARAEAAIAALETEHARVAVALRALSNG